MRGRQVLIGILWYLTGVVALLILALLVSGGTSLLQMVSAADVVAIIFGAVVVAIGGLTIQRFDYERPAPAPDAEGARIPRDERQTSKERYLWSTLALVIGGAMGCAVTPGADTSEPEVHAPRGTFDNLIIDGDRDTVSVLFDHDHADEAIKRRGVSRSCAECHHLNFPNDEATPCSQCHRRMKSRTDIFDHDYHAERQGNCESCHPAGNGDLLKNRENTVACVACHAPEGSPNGSLGVFPMVPVGVAVKIGEGDNQGLARSYVDAMHNLCIDCHRREGQEERTQCHTCHPTGGVQVSVR